MTAVVDPASGAGSAPVWLLDLDNTLHDAMPVIFPRINRAMTEYIARKLELPLEAAGDLRTTYWHRYGATLLGMVRHHQVDAHEFLREAHPFPDMEQIVRRNLRLHAMLRRLPGRKIVMTNSPARYAHAVLRAMRIGTMIDGVITMESMCFGGRFMPKPSRPMLRKMLARLRCPPGRAILVEDSVNNLRSATHCGVRTVLVTGLGHGALHPARRPRAGTNRSAGVQVQSVTKLLRVTGVRTTQQDQSMRD